MVPFLMYVSYIRIIFFIPCYLCPSISTLVRPNTNQQLHEQQIPYTYAFPEWSNSPSGQGPGRILKILKPTLGKVQSSLKPCRSPFFFTLLFWSVIMFANYLVITFVVNISNSNIQFLTKYLKSCWQLISCRIKVKGMQENICQKIRGTTSYFLFEAMHDF